MTSATVTLAAPTAGNIVSASADAISRRLRTDRRKAAWGAMFFVAPLVAFLSLTFVAPLGIMLFYAISNPEVRTAFPETQKALADWDGRDPMPEAAYVALVSDMKADVEPSVFAEAGRRLNYEITGFRSLLSKTVRNVKRSDLPASRQQLTEIDAAWLQPEYWLAIQRNASPVTTFYLLSALDLRPAADGGIERAPAEERLFVSTLGRTFTISATVTIACLLLGYPIANAIVSSGRKFSALLLASVLLPFWTSLLVRTSAWIVILQKEGIVNRTLQAMGLTSAPLELIFNRTGLYIAMIHILLPFMVLPLVSVMKGISPSYVRASLSLGASPVTTFLKVYLPLTLPGVGAGILLTFIISAGYYVTPTLVGGAQDQMLSYFVAFFANTTINWGMSAALGALLLACVLGLYVTVGRLVGIERIVGIK